MSVAASHARRVRLISKPVSKSTRTHWDLFILGDVLSNGVVEEFSFTPFGEVTEWWKLKMKILVSRRSHTGTTWEWVNVVGIYIFISLHGCQSFSCKVNFIYRLLWLWWDSGLISMSIWFQNVNMSANVAWDLMNQ